MKMRELDFLFVHLRIFGQIYGQKPVYINQEVLKTINILRQKIFHAFIFKCVANDVLMIYSCIVCTENQHNHLNYWWEILKSFLYVWIFFFTSLSFDVAQVLLLEAKIFTNVKFSIWIKLPFVWNDKNVPGCKFLFKLCKFNGIRWIENKEFKLTLLNLRIMYWIL